MTIHNYIVEIQRKFQSGISREHSYRGDFENLFKSLVPDTQITNEPANVTDCGNPDYVITKKKIPTGYIEAKDIGKNLNSKTYKEQFDRYKNALDNLIITDYLWFQFFQDGQLVHEIRLAEFVEGKIVPLPDNFEQFTNLLIEFSQYIGQTIRSSKKLAEMMAAKARLLQNILERAVTSDEESQENTSLQGQYESFKQILIHDLTPKGFADIYAQTLAYGMFAARLHDDSLEDFSRYEAAELIPKSNPFLRKLFGYVAGSEIDERIKTTVDNLADVFRATDVRGLLENFGKSTQQHDPIIHFYEYFLAEYDPKLRKSRGVWYTPEPVVDFIVRAVDDILKTEFDLPQGLADNSKTKIKINTDITDKRSSTGYKQVEKEVHRVQILDPATGTGTFLAQVIKHIYNSKFKNMQGAWSGYVEDHLIPRLNGFELLMASYAMAHLKLDMLLEETGYKAKRAQRLNVFLTNSLEEYHPDTGTLFSGWLSSEANEANHIKRDTPVMCVIGNPPYAVSSTNKNEWIEGLMYDYKMNLNERNIQPLSDDYVKFIRYGQYFIDKNGSGVLAYISNNSFLDGLIHRQMRKSILQTFDKTYIVDLHGNSKKKETAHDGSIDQNVFDIMQGVSINIFIKTGKMKKNQLGQVHSIDLFGRRDHKYSLLNNSSIESFMFKELKYDYENYFFTEKNFEGKVIYNKGFSLDKLFQLKVSGIKTQRDDASIKFNQKECDEIKNDFLSLGDTELRTKYGFKDVRDWTIDNARQDLESNRIIANRIAYRPFDNRFMNYTGKTKGIQGYPRMDVMKHLISHKNICLLTCRQQSTFDFQHIFISRLITDMCTISSQTREGSYVFPLYLYYDLDNQTSTESNISRLPNFNDDVIKHIEGSLKLKFTNEKEFADTSFAPIDLLDYIYAILHSPSYREKYKEFLKIDFPHIPYPTNKEQFWKLVELGGQIRKIHLLESPKVDEFITSYPVDGSNEITRKMTQRSPGYEPIDDTKGKVWINDEQYFDNVPLIAWEFYIGGYQPAQKWLKDRKDRTLDFDDILHYQRIIVALSETERLMGEVDNVFKFN